jgi:hypothetical protein
MFLERKWREESIERESLSQSLLSLVYTKTEENPLKIGLETAKNEE